MYAQIFIFRRLRIGGNNKWCHIKLCIIFVHYYLCINTTCTTRQRDANKHLWSNSQIAWKDMWTQRHRSVAHEERGGGVKSRHYSFKCGTTCSSGVSSTVRVRRDGDRFGSEKRNILGKRPTRTEEPSSSWNASSRWGRLCSVGYGGAKNAIGLMMVRGEIAFLYFFLFFFFRMRCKLKLFFSVVFSRSVCSDLFYLIG